MGCMTGTGAQLAATGWARNDAVAAAVLASLDIQSMGEWNAMVEELPAPKINVTVPEDGYVVMPYCLGKIMDHESFEVVCYHNPEINLGELIGNVAMYTRTHQDGSTWSGSAAVVSAQLMPNEVANELSMSTLSIRFASGATHDPFVPT